MISIDKLSEEDAELVDKLFKEAEKDSLRHFLVKEKLAVKESDQEE